MNVYRNMQRGRDVQERKKKRKKDGNASAIRCQDKESEFPFSRRSTEGIGPRAGSSYDRISHWRTRRAPAVDTSCHLSWLTTTGRSRSISDIYRQGYLESFMQPPLLRRRRLFRTSSIEDSINSIVRPFAKDSTSSNISE